MENQLPLYLDQHLTALGVLQPQQLSQQDELYMPYEVDMSYNMPELDENGEPPF
jgi:hypothetical protein